MQTWCDLAVRFCARIYETSVSKDPVFRRLFLQDHIPPRMSLFLEIKLIQALLSQVLLYLDHFSTRAIQAID